MTPKERLVTVREGEAREVVLQKCTKNALKKRWWLMTNSIYRHDHRERFPESRT